MKQNQKTTKKVVQKLYIIIQQCIVFSIFGYILVYAWKNASQPSDAKGFHVFWLQASRYFISHVNVFRNHRPV